MPGSWQERNARAVGGRQSAQPSARAPRCPKDQARPQPTLRGSGIQEACPGAIGAAGKVKLRNPPVSGIHGCPESTCVRRQVHRAGKVGGTRRGGPSATVESDPVTHSQGVGTGRHLPTELRQTQEGKEVWFRHQHGGS